METNKIYKGLCLDVIKTFPDNSVDCVITSPPYWMLRDYGFENQWGMEPTFDLYLQHLWELMDEVKRVLKPTGTAWINLGDTYGTKSGAFGNGYVDPKNPNATQSSKTQPDIGMHKCLLLIPHRFAIGCIDRGWVMRNDIIWAKRNGMPESAQDRFSKKHEYFFFMAKNQDYFFDLDAVRDKHKEVSLNRIKHGFKSKHDSIGDIDLEEMGDRFCHPGGKNPGSVADFWDIPTRPSKESHYAQYSDQLLIKPILAGCPEFVCNKCGKPREKIIETTSGKKAKREDFGEQPLGNGQQSSSGWEPPTHEIKGYTDCGCGAGFSGGIILDPFAGSGTTLLTGLRANRRVIGIEGADKYFDMASKRLAIALSAPTLL